MNAQLQTAILGLLALLVVAVAIVAVNLWQLNHDLGPIVNSPAARAIAGLGASG